jgi:undecaprenyl-diphosphatase
MSILEAIIIGIVQGLSEFLPISSTAHMTLAGRGLGVIGSPQSWTAFIAVVQLGTLAAVLFYFRHDLISITRHFVRENVKRVPLREQSVDARMGWGIIIGTIPIATIGLLVKDFIEGAFTKNLVVIGTSLIVLGVILEIAERYGRFDRGVEKTTLKDALWVGLAQVLALIPGSSRSGTTMTAGMFLGLTREAAARYSFLLSIPAIGASGLLELAEVADTLDSAAIVDMLVATVVAGISGYACIAFLLRYLRTRTMRAFVLYRVLLGGGLLVAILLGGLEP